MTHPIDIIGIGADGPAGLRAELLDRIRRAEFLAGGERHLALFPHGGGSRFTVRDNLVGLLEELDKRQATQRCVVLASGDPLFFGIGTYIIRVLGADRVRVEPALTSMQLAFARAGMSWQDAALASIHGRDRRTNLLPLLGKRKIGLFTQDGRSPAQVARFFLQFGAPEYEAVVGEHLGGADERVSRFPSLEALAEQDFAPLNYLILQRKGYPVDAADVTRCRSFVPGVPDGVFARPPDDQVMTKQEIRAIVLSKIAGVLHAGDTVWDVGAGLGTVAVEIAVLRPDVEVIAIERDSLRAGFLRTNRARFDAYNIRVLEGTAPAALESEKDSPRLVFLGGSGSHLPAILTEAEKRLRLGGRLLANFVTLEHFVNTFGRFASKGWSTDVTEIHVARRDSLGGQTGLKPMRGVFMVCAEKPMGR